MKQIKLTTLMLLCVFALCATMLTTYAAYTMTATPIAVTVTVEETLTVSSVPSTISVGAGPIVITATCSDTNYAGTVTFLVEGTAIGTSPASGGVATYSWNPTTVGSFWISATATYP